MASLGRRGGGAGAVALVLLLALAAWWVQSTTGDVDDAADPAASPSARSSVDAPGHGGDATEQPAGMPASDAASGLPYVDLADLPPEAADVVDLIDRGGPFTYDQDGSTFGNYEGLLPDRPGGYYREYTVETPGSDDRGARRIVGGAEGELYWTEDHYESFEVIWR